MKLDVIIYVDSKNNIKSKLEKQIQTLDLPDLQMAYEFMQNYRKFKEKIIWGVFKNLQGINSSAPVLFLLESSEKQSTKTQKPKYMRLEHFTER